MAVELGIIDFVRRSAAERILFLPHAVKQMSRPDRMISPDEVRKVIEAGEVIEEYPEDARGQSCLLLGGGQDGRAIHVVCSPKADDYLVVITAYLPDPDAWQDGFRTRTK